MQNTISWPLFFALMLLSVGFFYVYGEGLRRLCRKFGMRDKHPLFGLLAVPMGLVVWGIGALLTVLEEIDRQIGFQLWPYIPLSVGLAIFATYSLQMLLVETQRTVRLIVLTSFISAASLMGAIFLIVVSMKWSPPPVIQLLDWGLATILLSMSFFWFSYTLAMRISRPILYPVENAAHPFRKSLRLARKLMIAWGQSILLMSAVYLAWHGVLRDPQAISLAPTYAHLSFGSTAITLGVCGLLLTMLVTGLVLDKAESHALQLVSELTEQTQILTYAHERDLLTTLPNRLAAERHITEIIGKANRHQGLFSIIYIGIDNFRSINESLGFEAGDHVLMLTAERIRQAVQITDFVARMGGDEFAVIAPNCNSPAAAVTVGAKLVDALARHYELAIGAVPLSASVGIAMFPEDGRLAADLLSHANLAMSEAKKTGRNQYRFFSKEMSDAVKRDFTIQAELRSALGSNQFELFFQPQFDMQDCRLSGCEALVRWRLPDGTLRFPDKFIGVAERSGLIIPLGNEILLSVCATVRDWLTKYGNAIRVGVNVSALQFEQPDFIDTVLNALVQTAIPPKFLQIELTESTVMHDAQISLARFEALRDMGVQVAIDDFGTGYSSLAYLKKLVCQHIKIDRSFVRDITHDAGDRHIVKAMIDLAHNFGLTTVAEGVETLEQQNLLMQLGCDETQGYFYSQPISEEQFVEHFLLNGLAAAKMRPIVVA